MGNRQRIKDSLPEGEQNRSQLAAALSNEWKSLPDDQKQQWKDKNEKIKKEFEDYKSRGGIVTPGAYAKRKERKESLNGGAGKGRRRKSSAVAALATYSDEDIIDELRQRNPSALAAACSDEDLIDELRQRLSKVPRLPVRDLGAEAATTVRETADPAKPDHVPAATASEDNDEPIPDPTELLGRYGKKVPQEEHDGMKVWMQKRLKTITADLASAAGVWPARKEVWVAAKEKWQALGQEKKEYWASKAP